MAIVEKALIGKQDKLLTFGATGAITTGSKTYYCGGSDGVALDMNTANLEGFGVNFRIDTAFKGLTDATFKIEVSDNKTQWKEAASSPVIALADLSVDAVNVVIPRGAPAGRYVRAGVYTTGTATAGEVTAIVDTFAGL